jgi:hypothetical protein
MLTTITLAGWIVAAYYTVRTGGPVAIVRALRSEHVPRRYKIILALCALPIIGPFDELLAAAVLARIAARTQP